MEMSKEMSVLPTSYWPPIDYVRRIYHDPNTLIEVCENYQKKSIRNKCHIITSNGPLALSVPLLKGKHGSLPIKEVKIAYHDEWQFNHINTLKTAYSSAPYYKYYSEAINDLINKKETFLYELNCHLLEWIRITFLKDQVSKILKTETYHSNTLTTYASSFPYCQVYERQHGFWSENISILDLIFNVGYEIPLYLDNWINFDH